MIDERYTFLFCIVLIAVVSSLNSFATRRGNPEGVQPVAKALNLHTGSKYSKLFYNYVLKSNLVYSKEIIFKFDDFENLEATKIG